MACIYPFFVANPSFPRLSDMAKIPVPCGKCPPCLQRRSAEWCFRIFQESKDHLSALFITLTYDNDSLNRFEPGSDGKLFQPCITPNGFMTLYTPDFQNFMKRLRKVSSNKLRYYAVGEYGGERSRPHYHAILFGASAEDVEKAWNTSTTYRGLTQAVPMTEATVQYVCKYLHKGKSVPAHANDDRRPEYSLMSKGIGKRYLTDAMVKFHRDDITRMYVIHNGFKKAMPRYYKVRLFDDADRYEVSELVSWMHAKAEWQRRDDFFVRTGSYDGYEDSVRESRKALVQNFQRRASLKRKDL